jgi:hypothetical protein
MKRIVVFAALAMIFFFAGSSSAQLNYFWGNAGQITGPRADQSNVFGEGPFHYGQYAGLGRIGVGDLYSQTNECRLFYHHTGALRSQYKAKTAEYNQALTHSAVSKEQVAQLKAEMNSIYDEILKNGPRRNFPCPW